jgi:hypothetical protein
MNKTRTLVSFDWAIKNILRDKANYDVLEGFLSTLLDQDIKILSLLESESNQEDQSDKLNRVDLSVEDEALMNKPRTLVSWIGCALRTSALMHS